MIAITRGLVDRGHEVTVFLSERMPLDISSINDRQRGSARVVRYKDSLEDHDAAINEFVAKSLQNQISLWDQLTRSIET